MESNEYKNTKTKIEAFTIPSIKTIYKKPY